jgi:SAM-dependent methyltransferase
MEKEEILLNNHPFPPILLFGSGNMKKDNALRIDINPRVQPDVLHDLDSFPYPFPDHTFSRIECYDILEHLDDLVNVMQEIHRIGRHKAPVIITTPHFSSSNAYTDPTHRHFLGYYSFDYFTGENEWSFYTNVHFEKKDVYLHFYPSLINRCISIIANRRPKFYERRLAWIFPAWYLYIELEIQKIL